jgi:integrase
MRVRLKGLAWATKKLADGSKATYWYAWRGGPRLPGEPGTPEFNAAYNAAIAGKVELPRGALAAVLRDYQTSAEFSNLAPRTQQDYQRKIVLIEREFGDFPLPALSDRRTRSVFLRWRDELAKTSPRQSDYVLMVLARTLSWALNRGIVEANPLTGVGRVYRGTRRDAIWTPDDERLFLERAPQQLRLPFLIAIETSLRQGDTLALAWNSYDGRFIRTRLSKTGARVVIPVSGKLRAVLDATPRTSPIICLSSTGRPWTSKGFQCTSNRAIKAAGIQGLTFHDLRGTAVSRLAIAGATEAEIATFTGHSLRDVHDILDRHYLARDPSMAEAALHKLEKKV